jgi:8-oxo-dGTP pyrophosphatase MutT (NUDIX family)
VSGATSDESAIVASEQQPVRLIQRDVVYQNSKFTVVRDTQELVTDGSRHHWESVLFAGSALILPIDPHGYVYLVDQYRPLLERFSLEIVGGRLDGDEPAVAARRELLEETGIKARMIYLGTPELSTANVRCQEHFFLAVVEEVGTAEPEPFEAATLRPMRRIPLEDAVELVMRREVVDLATVALILLAVEHRRRYGLEPAPA